MNTKRLIGSGLAFVLLLTVLGSITPTIWSKIDSDLLAAAAVGDITRVKELIEAGADITAKNEYDETSLMLAAYHSRNDVAQLLKDAGAKE